MSKDEGRELEHAAHDFVDRVGGAVSRSVKKKISQGINVARAMGEETLVDKIRNKVRKWKLRRWLND